MSFPLPFPSNAPLQVIGVAALVAIMIPLSATAQCPENTASVIGTTINFVEQFNYTDVSTNALQSVASDVSSASHDLTRGTVNTYAAISTAGIAWREESIAIATDVFELHHSSSAQFIVRLNVSGVVVTDPSGRISWVWGTARLTVGEQSVETTILGPQFAPSIELEIVVNAGEPFTVRYETSCGASGQFPHVSLNGALEFVGLPVGAEVTSCNGFGESPVPVQHQTWGKIKALHR